MTGEAGDGAGIETETGMAGGSKDPIPHTRIREPLMSIRTRLAVPAGLALVSQGDLALQTADPLRG
jgi:hypothetical protein